MKKGKITHCFFSISESNVNGLSDIVDFTILSQRGSLNASMKYIAKLYGVLRSDYSRLLFIVKIIYLTS